MWECGGCGQPEDTRRKLDRACHHCGQLLCAECRVVLVDGAFGGPLVSADRVAVHCRRCQRLHHPAAVPLESKSFG